MWLNSIARTAKAGAATDVPLPPVTFTGEQRPNRVDKTGDGLAPYVRLRMSQVNTETGGTIGVTYSQQDCTPTTLPAADATNTKRCYPVKWVWEGEDSKLDWFNTYVVTQIVEGDNLASTPDKVTSYTYVGGAAWDKDTSEFTKAEDRVHSVPRGYEVVQTRTGAASDPKMLSETRYFRGLDGKEVKDGTGAAVTDRPEFAYMVRETATYEGDDTTKLVTASSSTPGARTRWPRGPAPACPTSSPTRRVSRRSRPAPPSPVVPVRPRSAVTSTTTAWSTGSRARATPPRPATSPAPGPPTRATPRAGSWTSTAASRASQCRADRPSADRPTSSVTRAPTSTTAHLEPFPVRV